MDTFLQSIYNNLKKPQLEEETSAGAVKIQPLPAVAVAWLLTL